MRKVSIFLLLAAFFMPLAMNAQNWELKKRNHVLTPETKVKSLNREISSLNVQNGPVQFPNLESRNFNSMSSSNATSGRGTRATQYEKVTSELTDWSGNYILGVNAGENVYAFDGNVYNASSYYGFNTAGFTSVPQTSSGSGVISDAGDAAILTFEEFQGYGLYTIIVNDSYYLGSDSITGLKASSSLESVDYLWEVYWYSSQSVPVLFSYSDGSECYGLTFYIENDGSSQYAGFCNYELSYSGSTFNYYWTGLYKETEVIPEEEITIGSGSTTNAYVPTRTQRKYSLTQQIYTADEIGYSGGTITSVSFYASRSATRKLDIYMVNTTLNTISSSTALHPTSDDKVVNAQSVSFASGWTKITFDEPFEYTGGNVVLIVDDNTGSATNQATNFRVFTANNQAIYVHGAQSSTSTNYNPTSTTNYSYTAQNQKNQVKFTIIPAPTLVESITASDLTLTQGFTAQIDYTVSPDDATDPSVSFTSADETIATVDENGVVFAVSAGTTTITIAANDESGVSTTINVTVDALVGLLFDFEDDPTESWTFVDSDGDGFNWEWEDSSETPHNTTFEGEGCLFSASYDNDNHVALTPNNWAITPAIHILNSPSVIAFYAMGQDASYAEEHFQVYIGTTPDPSSMTAISEEFVATGNYEQYIVNIPDTYAGQIVYFAIVHQNCTDMFVLVVDYVIITNAELAPEGILVESIVVNPDEIYPTVGATYSIVYTVLPADATNPAVTFSSSDDTVATVDENGTVTAVAAGTATITITATDGSGVTGTLTVNVMNIDVEEITASDITVVNGQTATINYQVLPEQATDKSVTFTSADATIATVDADGVVTGVGVGETTITIASVQNPEVTKEITVTVTSNPYAVQFTVNAPDNAHPGDVITVEGVLTAPTSGTWNGFTALILDINYDNTAFEYVANSLAYGPVATQAQQNGAFMMTGEVQLGMIIADPSNSVTTEGVVFSAQFTVLEGAEGEYTFTAIPPEGGNLAYDLEYLPYEATPSTVEISELSSYFKHIDGYQDPNNGGCYFLIASPIGEVNPTAVVDSTDVTRTMVSGNYDLYYFDDDQEMEWINYKQGAFNLEPGKGYLYANKYDIDLMFSGTGNREDIEIILHKSETNGNMAGWNLVGNPYDTTAYLADGRDFYTMNSTGTLIVDSITSTSIEPMEGVFVVADHDGESIHFTITEPEPESNDKSLVLNLTQGRGIVDRAIIRFGEGRTLPKFQILRNSTKVYIPVDNQDYAVVRSEEVGEMPVSFKAEENGVYTLSFSAQNTEFGYLHLIDNLTGKEVDLLATPSYSFEGKTTDYANRFKLVYATGNATDENFAFFSNGSFVINNEGNATLQVIDINGRILSSETINGCANVYVNAASGVYMLRLVNGDNVKVQKVVVR